MGPNAARAPSRAGAKLGGNGAARGVDSPCPPTSPARALKQRRHPNTDAGLRVVQGSAQPHRHWRGRRRRRTGLSRQKSQLVPLRSPVIAPRTVVPGGTNVTANVTTQDHRTMQRGVKLMRGEEHCRRVASGKGGVGKSPRPSTWRWRWPPKRHRGRAGRRHLRPQPAHDDGHHGPPGVQLTADHGKLENHGVQVMSIGFLVEPDQADGLARPHGHAGADAAAAHQLARPRLPAGRHAAGHRRHRSSRSAQKVPLTGAVIVTTPQDIALLDART